MLLGRLVSVTDPLGASSMHRYDNKGNLVETIDRNGTRVYTEYDGMSRAVRTSNSADSGEIIYQYDILGRIISAESNGKRTEYGYNAYGELERETSGEISLVRRYNGDGKESSFTMLYGGIAEQKLEYCYNEQGLLSGVSTPAGTQKYEYDKAGRLVTGENFATGINTAYTYYPSGAVKSIVLTGSDGEMLDGLWYEYDKSGNKLVQFENDVETLYGYDSQNRLKREQKGDVHTEYYYDAYNNISEIQKIIGNGISGINTRYYYDACNRLLLTDENGYETLYGYDANGRMTSVTAGSQEKYYGYDGFGRMTLAAVGDSITNYEYGHAGLRTAKIVNGKRTELINNGSSVIAELSEGEITNYYRGLTLIGFENNDEYYYYKLNAHGDTIGILDSFGQQVKEYSYDAFGNEQNLDIFDTNPFRYCGEYYDNETGLIYLRARYYDSNTQRFISEDPIRDGFNWYAYCGNNPPNLIDLSGTSDERIGQGIWSLKSDAAGRAILFHWLYGNGQNMVLDFRSWGARIYDGS